MFIISATAPAAADDVGTGSEATAVCLLPGTEIVFDKEIELTGVWEKTSRFPADYEPPVATFRQINGEQQFTHHDALEFKDGVRYLITTLVEGQTATVLQLPAEAKAEAETKAEEVEQGIRELVTAR